MRVTNRNRWKARRNIRKQQIRDLDQAAYRFAKLQDGMGQKVLPDILGLAPCLRRMNGRSFA